MHHDRPYYRRYSHRRGREMWVGSDRNLTARPSSRYFGASGVARRTPSWDVQNQHGIWQQGESSNTKA